MPAIQTTYGQYHAAAVEGMVANSEPADIISRIVEGSGGIGFGKAAVQGTADDQIKVSAASTKFRGITMLDPTQDADLYPQYATAAVMVKGVIWVLAGATVVVGDPVYVIPASGVFTNSSSGNTAIPNAIFDSSAASGALVKVRLG